VFVPDYPALKIPAAKAAGISGVPGYFQIVLAGRKDIAVYFKLNTLNAFSSRFFRFRYGAAEGRALIRS
jgi:hypothetical protein